MKRKKGQLLAEIRTALEMRPDGMDSAELAAHCRMTRAHMAVALWCMKRDGHLRATGGREQLWSIAPTAPARPACDQLVKPLHAPRRSAAIPALAHVTLIGAPRSAAEVREAAVDAGLVLGLDVKITVCPGGMDTRFSVDPRTFRGGDSMAEWNLRRTA